MNINPVANGQLELACKVGSVEAVLEALDEGADVDCNGYSPIFIAIQGGAREVLAVLVERGANAAIYQATEDKGDVVEQLMQMAPKTVSQTGDGMQSLDAKMVRAFDRMIRSKGVAEPVRKGRWDEYKAFREALRSLAAEECCGVVEEFITKAEDGAGAFLQEAANAELLDDLSKRYRKAEEDEQPRELLKDYLKEQKKVV